MRRAWWILAVLVLSAVMGPASAGALVWSGPELIDPGTSAVATDLGGVSFVPGNAITGVSCPSLRLCVAIDDQGNILHSTAPTASRPTWTRVHLASGGLSAIACPSTTLCIAAGQVPSGAQGILISTHPTGKATAWRPLLIGVSGLLAGISCPTKHLCVAVDTLGDLVTTTDPLGGAAAWRVENHFGGTAISCPSAHFCAVLDDAAVQTSTHPARGARGWSPVKLLPSAAALPSALSCASTVLCVGVDDDGNAIVSRDPGGRANQWHVVAVDPANVIFCTCDAYAVGLTGVSCPASTFCAAVDGAGNVLTSTTPARPTRSSWRITRMGGGVDAATWLPFSGIACHTRSLCVAFDDNGQVSIGTPARVRLRPSPACDRHKPSAGVVGPQSLIYAITSPTRTDYFACQRPGGRSYSLGQTSAPIAEYGPNDETGDLVVAGTLVGAQTETGAADYSECSKYSYPDCTLPPRSIVVIDTRTGRRVTLATDPSAAHIAVSAAGAVAWLEHPAGGGATRLLATALHPSGAAAFIANPQQLDAGPIDPGSLRFDGLTLSWTDGGQPKSATVG